MPRQHPEQHLELRGLHSEWSPPLPIYHHPLIAASIILVVASIVQIGVWMLTLRLLTTVNIVGSTAAVPGVLFYAGVDFFTRGNTAHQPLTFGLCLMLALFSSVFWYAAVRLAVGPGWALWTALLWVTHPAFAFLAQRPSALVLAMLFVPAVLAGLAWWRIGRMPLPAAIATGAALGCLTLNVTAGLLILPIALLAILFAGGSRRLRLVSAALIILGDLVVIILWVYFVPRSSSIAQILQGIAMDAWNRITVDGSRLSADAQVWAAAYRGDPVPHPVRFLLAEARREPWTVVQWFAQRTWGTLYRTADGGLQRPLFFLQLCWLVPALWGYVVAVRFRPWRWMAVTASGFVAVFWMVAALAEPLARNLTPVGGIPLVLAIIALADLYERVFHRRLTKPIGRAAEIRPR